MNGEHKITGWHRERTAVVYLRQSSMVQVREHTESTLRQYGLAEEAVRLGWPASDVQVIDTDLGISGRFGVAREGFTDLVSRVCGGDVGAIFGIEISRLARSNADVARLMEFAKITGTLLIDADGVYDPGDINDRMLLGLSDPGIWPSSTSSTGRRASPFFVDDFLSSPRRQRQQRGPRSACVAAPDRPQAQLTCPRLAVLDDATLKTRHQRRDLAILS